MTDDSVGLTATPEPSQAVPELVLVVGDWVIDEYWLQVRHHSRISSHTGFVHYRIESPPNTEILDLCGAGHVMRILTSEMPRHPAGPRLIGIGHWNSRDQEEILHLLHARHNRNCRANKALYRQRREYCDQPPAVELHTLCPDGTTTSVIRQYRRGHSGIEQISRVDWELREHEPSIPIAKLDLPRDPKNVLVAIHDLRKGVVTTEVVTQLIEQYPNARFCVRTKNLHRAKEWLEILGDRLLLHVIGPEVAAKLNPWNTWISNDRASHQALMTVDGVPGVNAFLLSDRHEVIGKTHARECLVLQSQTRHDITSQLGWSASMFAALVREVARHGPNLTEAVVRDALKLADAEAGLPLGSQVKPEEPISRKSRWQKELETWASARKGLGLIKSGDHPRLDVWRGAALLPEYIACIREKEQVIRRIGAHLRRFKNQRERPSGLSILLQSDPGSGKTFLASRLAATFHFILLRFDVTQMIHREDLLELFDTVATRQADNPKADLIVFVDEINAELDNSSVYSAFLAPVEEGYYNRRGNAFALRPCVWLFAGTEPASTRNGKERSKSQKYSDFESRMTLVERIDFSSLKKAYEADTAKLQDEARLEQVYLGASMTRRLYPDVTRISKRVLQQFYNLDPARAPARKIRRMCEALRDVQYGMVSKRNCDGWSGVTWTENEQKVWIQIEA